MTSSNLKPFSDVAITLSSEKWENCIERKVNLYAYPKDIRSPFERDYNRILHCNAYDRLKHKNQVFFATHNDHICTRIQHVNYVAAISYSISNYLGLNSELANAIAIGHDLGHAPFAHEGEVFLNDYSKNKLNKPFWHEKNSLRFVDLIETLPDNKNNDTTLNLTYAVRDGIVCHCGEDNFEPIFPRDNVISLERINKSDKISPYTWEGCVVKLSDKISYLGRDIDDSKKLDILDQNQLNILNKLLTDTFDSIEYNSSRLIQIILSDLIENSSVDNGIQLSSKYNAFINNLQEFSINNIYKHYRVENFKKYVQLILSTLTDTIDVFYT